MSEASDSEQGLFTILAIVSAIITTLFILFIVIWRKCIARLVAILEECTKVSKPLFFISRHLPSYPVISLPPPLSR